MTYAKLKPRLARSPFRSRFRLTEKDKAYLAEKGWENIRTQALEILTKRLAPAFPESDGKQTPMRGHPVFKAQHACAVCCRSCLAKWHGIPAGIPLTEAQLLQLADCLVDWLRDRATDLSRYPRTPSLF